MAHQNRPVPASASEDDNLDRITPLDSASHQPSNACPKGTMDPKAQDNTSVDASLSCACSRSSGPRSKSGNQDSSRSSGVNAKTEQKNSVGQLLTKLKGWVATSEPSSRALKQYKKETFEKAGLSLDDPDAAVKLEAPKGRIPEDAIKASGRGPGPEDIARLKALNKKGLGGIYVGTSSGSRASQ